MTTIDVSYQAPQSIVHKVIGLNKVVGKAGSKAIKAATRFRKSSSDIDLPRQVPQDGDNDEKVAKLIVRKSTGSVFARFRKSTSDAALVPSFSSSLSVDGTTAISGSDDNGSHCSSRTSCVVATAAVRKSISNNELKHVTSSISVSSTVGVNPRRRPSQQRLRVRKSKSDIDLSMSSGGTATTTSMDGYSDHFSAADSKRTSINSATEFLNSLGLDIDDDDDDDGDNNNNGIHTGEHPVQNSYYRTITQNEYLEELMGENHGCALVHLFDTTTSHNQELCKAIDEQLSRLSSDYRSSCQFFRMNGTLSSLVARKLGITSLPALIPIRNGIADTRFVPDLGKLSKSELERGIFVQALVELFVGGPIRTSTGATTTKIRTTKRSSDGFVFPSPAPAPLHISTNNSTIIQTLINRANAGNSDESDHKTSSQVERKSTKTECQTYRTISQNEYFTELTGRHGLAILHFFDTTHPASTTIDEQLERLVKDSSSQGCKFLRISGALSPFFAPKLGVTSFPALVALRNGKVEARLSNRVPDLNKLTEKELQEGKFVQLFVQLVLAGRQGIATTPTTATKTTAKQATVVSEHPASPMPSRHSFSGQYRTITQNDYFAELTGNHGCAIIHFFDTRNPDKGKISTVVDRQLEQLAMVHRESCKFLRMSGALSLFVAPKLGVTSFPAVLAVQDGKVKARLANTIPDWSNLAEHELQRGAFVQEFVQSFLAAAFPPPPPSTKHNAMAAASRRKKSFPKALSAPSLKSIVHDSSISQEVDDTSSYGEYREITQMEFFAECVPGKHGRALIHFFDGNANNHHVVDNNHHDDDGSSISTSKAVSDCINDQFRQLAHLHKQDKCCKFMCIDGAMAPLIAPKLGITHFPAVLGFCNGLVEYRLSDVVPDINSLSKKDLQTGRFIHEFVLVTGYTTISSSRQKQQQPPKRQSVSGWDSGYRNEDDDDFHNASIFLEEEDDFPICEDDNMF